MQIKLNKDSNNGTNVPVNHLLIAISVTINAYLLPMINTKRMVMKI